MTSFGIKLMQQYSDIIKEHYQNPRNAGKLSDHTHSAEQINPICGDEIKIFLNIKKYKVLNIKYEARGCMISIATASVLSDFIKNKTLTEIKKIIKDDIAKLLEIKISPAREPCSLLALTALHKMIH